MRWDAALGTAGRVTAAGLSGLARDPDVVRIDLDVAGHAMDVQQNALIRANQAQAAGYRGDGVTVAVLDSGIQENHPDLADSLIGEHCITPPNGCPNHTAEQSGAGSARDENGHGTNVAGIITGNGAIAPTGVAPDSKIVAVRVLDRAGSFQATSQVISALQWILTNAPTVKAVNMSLGTDALFSGTCDKTTAYARSFASIAHSLRLRGMTLFASSGNQRSRTQMALPACLREVVAVGAVYDSAYGNDQLFCSDRSIADKVTCFSNSSSALDLLAPGAAITSTGLRSGTSTYYGTSQASPAVAGAAAILVQANPALKPAQIESTLKLTGKRITDRRNGRSTPRIDVLAALDAVRSGHLPVDAQPPAVRAYSARVERKKPAKLRFDLNDDSGKATVAAAIFRGRTRIKNLGSIAVENGRHTVKWRASASPSVLRFCVTAADEAGNRSKASCASVRVR